MITPVRFGVAGKGVGFIRVHMHGKAVVPAYADYDVCIDQGPAVTFGEDKNLVIVTYIQGKGIVRSHVDVAFGYDHASGNLKFSFRSSQNAAGVPLDIS